MVNTFFKLLHREHIDFHLCSSSFNAVLVMLVSLASLATISCDRMMGVARPFHTHLKTWQSLAIIVIIWVSSAVLAVPWGLYRVYTVSSLKRYSS